MTRLKVKPQLPVSVTGFPSSYRLTDWTLEIEIVDGQITRKHGDHTRGAIVHNESVAARLLAAPGRRLVPDGAWTLTTTTARNAPGSQCRHHCEPVRTAAASVRAMTLAG